MSNVIKLHSGTITLNKLFCDCGQSLEYWLGDDGCGYGICARCDLHCPEEVKVKGEEECQKH